MYFSIRYASGWEAIGCHNIPSKTTTGGTIRCTCADDLCNAPDITKLAMHGRSKGGGGGLGVSSSAARWRWWSTNNIYSIASAIYLLIPLKYSQKFC